MYPQIPIPGIAIRQTAEVIHIHSSERLTVLSSSFFGGGFHHVRDILNANVAEDYCSDDPAGDLRAIAGRLGVGDSFVGLLTAVPLRKARLACAAEPPLQVGVLATAGVGNATSAGISLPCPPKPGTINIVVLIDAKLTRSAMLNALITVTEAKSAVLNELAIRTPEGGLATGTSTDTVTLAMTGRGPALPFAGPATLPGWLIGQAVRQAVRESLLAP